MIIGKYPKPFGWIHGPKKDEWSIGFCVRRYYENYDGCTYLSIYFLIWELILNSDS